MVRKAIESLYSGLCTVTVMEPVKNPVNKRTEHVETVLIENQPCRLSFKNIPTTTNDDVAQTVQEVKLFISPDVSIPAGSKITVTQNGVTTDYKQSGVPAVYSNHQEITLELFKEWA